MYINKLRHWIRVEIMLLVFLSFFIKAFFLLDSQVSGVRIEWRSCQHNSSLVESKYYQSKHNFLLASSPSKLPCFPYLYYVGKPCLLKILASIKNNSLFRGHQRSGVRTGQSMQLKTREGKYLEPDRDKIPQECPQGPQIIKPMVPPCFLWYIFFPPWPHGGGDFYVCFRRGKVSCLFLFLMTPKALWLV